MNTLYEKYISILNEELVPAMGCTEPIAIAFAAAKAREVLEEEVEQAIIHCSSNIIKNVKCVRVPNTGGLIGVEAAALVGIVAGDSSKQLEVISVVSDEQRQELQNLLAKGICSVRHMNTEISLHIIAELKGKNNTVSVEITHTHTHVHSVTKNGKLIDGDEFQVGGRTERSCLNVKDIVEFANTIDLSLVKDLLERQVNYNLAVSDEGLKGGYGVNIGEIILSESQTIPARLAALTAAASEARMEGCSLPAVTNSGSGNQGITSSVPIATYCREKGYDHEKMLRGLLVSNLLCAHQKTSIGHLSAFCGAAAASAAAAGALTYLDGGDALQVGNAVKNTMASLAGMCCDGAKATCGFKIASGIHTAYYASRMALKNRNYEGDVGILKADVEDSIAAIGTLANKGMRDTDKVILGIMLNQ